MLAWLAGCATRAPDGPPPGPPPDVQHIPDAQPKIEPIRIGGPNKPYEALGQTYIPLIEDKAYTERGIASWYGRKFHGRRTANGEIYNMHAMTAAHRTMPLPSYARVRNPANGREIVVRVNDRGPFVRGRIIDLSYVAAIKLGVQSGLAPVEVTRITFEDIRSGAWRRAPGIDPTTPAAVADDAVPSFRSPPPVEPNAVLSPSEAPAVARVADTAAATALESPAAADGFWVQLGAFKLRAGADAFHRRVAADLEWLAPLLVVASDGELYRLQAGPYPARDEAQAMAQRVREQLRLVPMVVEKTSRSQ